MKIEKILACVLAVLVVLTVIVYFTLPEQGEQIYIPQSEHTSEDMEIPEGYQLVDNYTDVYFVEKEDGIHYYWHVKFSDGTYGWQEVDENGNIIFPNREPEETEPSESAVPEETTSPPTEPQTTETTKPPKPD